MLYGFEERGRNKLGALAAECVVCSGCPGLVVAWRGRGRGGKVAVGVTEWGSTLADDAAPAVGRGYDVAA